MPHKCPANYAKMLGKNAPHKCPAQMPCKNALQKCTANYAKMPGKNPPHKCTAKMHVKNAPQKNALHRYNAKMPVTMTANNIMQKCIAKNALKNDAEMHCANALQKYYVKMHYNSIIQKCTAVAYNNSKVPHKKALQIYTAIS